MLGIIKTRKLEHTEQKGFKMFNCTSDVIPEDKRIAVLGLFHRGSIVLPRPKSN